MECKEKEILEAAERMVREGGYNGFSFRDIAEKVGIKSSSVHYHFSTKEDLGAAIAKYYTDKFLKNLGEPQDWVKAKKDPVTGYKKAFAHALAEDKRMCLCGLLGAEIKGLPSKVVSETKNFFEQNIVWLTKAYTLKSGEKGARSKAIKTLALLEGGMIVASVLNDTDYFDEIIDIDF